VSDFAGMFAMLWTALYPRIHEAVNTMGDLANENTEDGMFFNGVGTLMHRGDTAYYDGDAEGEDIDVLHQKLTNGDLVRDFLRGDMNDKEHVLYAVSACLMPLVRLRAAFKETDATFEALFSAAKGLLSDMVENGGNATEEGAAQVSDWCLHHLSVACVVEAGLIGELSDSPLSPTAFAMERELIVGVGHSDIIYGVMMGDEEGE